jgi:hypothetical protein
MNQHRAGEDELVHFKLTQCTKQSLRSANCDFFILRTRISR